MLNLDLYLWTTKLSVEMEEASGFITLLWSLAAGNTEWLATRTRIYVLRLLGAYCVRSLHSGHETDRASLATQTRGSKLS